MQQIRTPLLFAVGLAVLVSLFLSAPHLGRAQTQPAAPGAAFTYQGRLSAAAGRPVDGACAFRFHLYPALSGGSALGTVSLPAVAVNDGYFSAALDFGPGAFTGQDRFLEIQVNCDGASYVTLSPRQQVHASPYALYSAEADNARALQGRAVSPDAPAAGQALKWDGTRWTPAQDETGGITDVSAGNGLTGGGTSSVVPLAVDFAGSGASQQAARSDHTHDARYQRQYKRTVIVSPSGNGSDASANGSALRNALNGISDVGATNPYLLVLEPGIYDVGGAPLQMKEFVDIAGSGRGVTVVRGAGSNTAPGATLRGADHSELRHLTVDAHGHGTAHYATAIYNDSVAPALTDIDVSAQGATQLVTGIRNKNSLSSLNRIAIHIDAAGTASGTPDAAGLYIEGGPAGTMADVTVLSQGGNVNRGVRIHDANPVLDRFRIDVRDAVQSQGIAILNSDSYNAGGGAAKKSRILNSQIVADGTGLYVFKASVTLIDVSLSGDAIGIDAIAGGSGEGMTIDRSTIRGETNSVDGTNGYDFKIGATQLDGPVDRSDASFQCSSVYDGDYASLGVQC
jgi:hypothetical protein